MILISIFTGLFLLFAVYLSLFSIWRIFEREHVDDIPASFDKMAIALAAGWYIARFPNLIDLVVSTHLSVFSVFNPFEGIASWQVAVSLFLLFFYLLSRAMWKDAVALLDYCVVALTVFLALYFLSQGVLTLSADLFVGNPLPVAFLALTFAGFFYFLGLGRLLAYFELQYRTFFWYRYRRSSAQTGFVLAIFLIGTGLFGAIGSFAFFPFPILSVSMFEILWSLFMVVSGFLILFIRSGRLKKR